MKSYNYVIYVDILTTSSNKLQRDAVYYVKNIDDDCAQEEKNEIYDALEKKYDAMSELKEIKDYNVNWFKYID